MAKNKDNTIEKNMAKTAVSMRAEVRNLEPRDDAYGGNVAAKAIDLGVDHENAVEMGVRAARRSWLQRALDRWLAVLIFAFVAGSGSYLYYIPAANQNMPRMSSMPAPTMTPTPDIGDPPFVPVTSHE